MNKNWIQPARPQDKLAVVRGESLSVPSPILDVADDMTLADAWLLVRKRRFFILSFVAAVVIATGAYSVVKTPRYEAVARIAINPEGPDGLNLEDIAGSSLVPRDTSTKLETEVRIIQSDSLGLQMLRDLKLGRKQLLTGSMDLHGYSPEASPKQQAKLLREYQKNLSVKVVPKTQVVEIRFRNPNPELAAKLANTLVSDYVERGVKTKFESTKQVSDWLTQQLDELKSKTQNAQEKLAVFQKENGIIGADEKNNIVTERLKQLNEQLTAAEADRILKEAKHRLASTRDPELIAAVVPTSSLQLLRAQQVEIRNQYTQANAKFGAGYPKVGELKTQLAQVDVSIENEVKNASQRIENEYMTAKKAEDLIRGNFDQQKQRAYELNGSAVQYGLLKREVDSSRDLYEGLLKKLKEAGIAAGLKSTQVNVVDNATIPAEPVEPNIPANLAYALAGGLLGGIVLTFVLESLDDSVQTVEQSEAVSLLPSLAMIPRFKSALNGKNGHARLSSATEMPNLHQVLALDKPNSQVAESYRTLRSSILLSAATPPKVLVITSSMPEEGKTTTSLNCAVVLAQKGARVLLLDGDIRRPSIHEALGISCETGLSNVLRGADDSSAMVPLEKLPNLMVLPAGPRCPYPAELLASDRMQELLAKWRTEYDHIVIDTPPISTVTDASILGAQADAVLLVIRCGQTRKQALRRTRDLLLRINANIVGVVVNAVDLSSPEHYGYYGMGHYYGKRNGNGYYFDGVENN